MFSSVMYPTLHHLLRRTRVLAAGLILALATAGTTRAQDFLNVQAEPVPPEVERIYQHGLDFLVATQETNGSWADSQNNVGIVGLAVLAILAHGEDPNVGPYADTVRKALDYLLGQANTDTGYIGRSMYNHGFATLALAEAYGQVDDDRLAPALQKAVALIVASQAKNPTGAWRYSPQSNDADTTVSGAIMVALFAARNAGIDVPDEVFAKAIGFYKRMQSPEDGGFGYTSPGGSNSPRTAIGVLVLALAKDRESEMYRKAFHWLKQNQDANVNYHQYYYLYYAAQAFFHSDPESWRAWNTANIKTLMSTQGTNGSWTGTQGATFTTSAALLSLAVNYRFLPIYER